MIPAATDFLAALLILLVASSGIALDRALARDGADATVAPGSNGSAAIVLEFFHSETCPHCLAAGAFLPLLQKTRPWLAIRRHAVDTPEGEALFIETMRRLGQSPEGVPTFVACGKVIVGFDAPDGIGKELAGTLDDCHRSAVNGEAPWGGSPVMDKPPRPLDLPFLGEISPEALSLPVVTFLLASLDAFNPCAFFVLLFLLSLMVNARSRARMALVGGVFVTISGVMYFVFMAAWLNLFLVLRSAQWITLGAGLVAMGIGLLGIKDFILRAGPSLSISEPHRESLFARMRGLLSAGSMPTLLLGTVALAVAANTYELICTSGFPMVFTRILTLHDLPAWQRYAYLAVYNVIYVIPLAAIVAIFVATMGRRKLTEHEGRKLKLMSGVLMLSTGAVLTFHPALFLSPISIVGLLAAAVAATLALAAAFPERHR